MANKLTFKRTDLVSSLETALATREEERQKKKDEIDAKNKEAADRIKGLIDEYPDFLVFLNSQIENKFGESATHVDLEKEVERYYGTRGVVGSSSSTGPGSYAATYDPDANLKRLIRVYKAADDEKVEIEETDDVLNFL